MHYKNAVGCVDKMEFCVNYFEIERRYGGIRRDKSKIYQPEPREEFFRCVLMM